MPVQPATSRSSQVGPIGEPDHVRAVLTAATHTRSAGRFGYVRAYLNPSTASRTPWRC